MSEQSQNFNNEIIDVNEFNEKLTDERKKNIIRIELPEEKFASGFLCKVSIGDILMPVLITCYHVLNEDYLKKNKFLHFSYFLKKEKKENFLDLTKPRLTEFNKENDFTIIEIKETDNLDIYSFLEMDNSINLEDPQIQDKKIYLLHFPKGVQNIQFSKGKITDIKDKIYFMANYSTEPGSSGCPIIDYQNNLVIGIHKAGNKGKNKKMGIILKSAIEIFSKNNKDNMKTYKNLYSRLNTMDMIYTIPDNDETLRLFGELFAESYKDVCKIV